MAKKKGITSQPARPKDLQEQLATLHCSMRVPADQSSEKENYQLNFFIQFGVIHYTDFLKKTTLHLGISYPTALSKRSVACVPVGELLCFWCFHSLHSIV